MSQDLNPCTCSALTIFMYKACERQASIFLVLWSKSLNGKCAKLHTVAASNNRDHRRDHSINACSCHIYLCVAHCAHPICGESHFQRNINWEVATTSPLFAEPQRSHILFVKVAPGTTFTSWSKHQFVVIGKHRRQICKASPCGTKQQQRSHVELILFLLVCDAFLWVLFFTYIRLRRITHSTQHWPSGCNTCSKVGLDFLKSVRVKRTSKMQTEKT